MDHSNDPLIWRVRRARLREFLREHHSSISTQELAAIGFSSASITQLVHDGELVRESYGVYRSASAPRTLESTLRCRLLRAGEGSVLTRITAAHHLGYLKYPAEIPQIGVPSRSGLRSDDQIERHAIAKLAPGDRQIVRGLPTTSPFLTVLHLASDAAEAGDAGSLRVYHRALRGASNDDAGIAKRLRVELDDNAPFPGSAIIARSLGGHTFGSDLAKTLVVRSAVEDRFVELCKRFNLPVPATNAWVGGFELDAHWVKYDAYVEINPYATHGDEVTFEWDQAKAGAMAALGLRGFPLSELRIDHFPREVADEVAGMLRRGGWPGR